MNCCAANTKYALDSVKYRFSMYVFNKMTNNKLLTTLFGILTCISVHSQESVFHNQDYSQLGKYRNMGIMVGPILYDKALNIPQYGEYLFENKPIPGLNFGLEYDFYPEKKWSLISGLYVNSEPVYNIRFRILEKDLYPDWTEDLVDKAKMYAIKSFSVPLLLQLNLQTGAKSFINFRTGLKIMYFPRGIAEFSLSILDSALSDSREIFGLRLKSPDFPLFGSYVVGTGVSYAMNAILLKLNLIYVMNFQRTITGEYQFGNLMSSSPTRGYYELTGNYLALQFSVNFKKPKNRWLKVNLHLNRDEDPVNLN